MYELPNAGKSCEWAASWQEPSMADSGLERHGVVPAELGWIEVKEDER